MNCIFCKIAQGEIPSQFVYESDAVFVIKDLHPKAKVHLLVIPKQHLVTFNDVTPGNQSIIGAMGLAIAAVTKTSSIAETGYKVVANNGRDAHQEVPHLHLHVLGGESVGIVV